MKKHSINFLLLILMSSPIYAFDTTINWSTWDDGLYIDHFKVYWGTSSKNYTNVSSNIASNQTSYTVTGLIDGQSYFYAVKAFDANGYESDFSNEISSFTILTPHNNFLANASNYKAFNFSGVGYTNSTVEIYGTDPLNPIASTTVKSDGTWSVNIDFTDLAQGPITITATHNSENASITGTYDRIAPDAPFSLIVE